MPEFLHVVWAVFLIVLFFGGSIFVHELGHYLAARKRGLKVDRFSIGFGPKLFSWKVDGVEWMISLFPLGGYVALPQLANLEGIEGEYSEEVKKLPPISYTSTVIVAVMGVVFNIIFAFALACVLWVTGRPSTDSQQTTIVGTVLERIVDTNGTEVAGPGMAAGLKAGDKILSIDGAKVENWRDVKQFVVTSIGRDAKGKAQMNLEVLREGKTINVTINPILAGPDKLRSMGILPQEDLFIGQIFKDSPAEKAGLQTGDQLKAVNNQIALTYYDYQKLVDAQSTKPFILTIERKGAIKNIAVAAEEVKITKSGKTQALLGFNIEPKVVTVYEDPITQIVNAAALTFRTLGTLIHPDSDIKLNHLSGPPGIAWVIYRLSSDFRQVLSFIVLINVNLAILNMLPLPVLDGGHITVATINKFRKKPISGEYIATVQNIFTYLLLALMAYVIFFSDVPRLGREFKQKAQDDKELKEEITPVFSKAVEAVK